MADLQWPCRSAQLTLARCADTEGSFMPERVAQIADACIKHLKRIAVANNNNDQAQAVRCPKY